MIKKWGLVLTTLMAASLILFTSVLSAATIKYSFYPQKTPESQNPKATSTPSTAYYFVYPGSILPDNPLWYVKTLRDRVQMTLTLSPVKKAEFALLLADKRLMVSKILFDRDKPELAFSTLTKGEKYLQMASDFDQINQKNKVDTASFELRLIVAALKHREVIETEILPTAPEDAKPKIIATEKYAKQVYLQTHAALEVRGITPPENPFPDN